MQMLQFTSMTHDRNNEDADKWQWLEAQDAPECLQWVDEQNKVTNVHLDALPDAARLRDRLRDLASDEARVPDFWLAGHLFRLRKSADNQEGVLEVAESGPSILKEWKKIVDIDELGRIEKKNFRFVTLDLTSSIIGPDPWRILLLLSVGGSDKVTIRELDIETGRVVQDGFCTNEGQITVAWMDTDHILINHDLGDSPKSAIGWSVNTYLWKRRTPLPSAKLIFQGELSDTVCLLRSFVSGSQRYGLLLRAIDLSTYIYYLITPNGSIQEVPFPRKLTFSSTFATSRHIITALKEPVMLDGASVPAGSVLAYDITPDIPDYKRMTVVYSPSKAEINAYSMQYGLKATRSRVYIVITTRATEELVVLECCNDSWNCIRRDKIAVGSHIEIIASDSRTEDIVLRQSGLLKPASIWLEQANNAPRVLYEQPQLFKSIDYVLEQRTANSKDGTEVDYMVLYPRSGQRAGDLRILMTGYGAFGLSFPMDYLNFMIGGVSLVPWLESGGALVIPFIRGGGERGDEWYQAAKLENRQRSYDDFAAVAMKLIADGFTSHGRIGVFGTSNGGLLAAVMGTQHPDLFSAVVSDVPLTDMLRYTKIGMGPAWIFEFGDPGDPIMEPVLRSYSPYHNINRSQKYPAFLLTVSTKDDRVGAGHARKLAAKLQDAGSPNAFLLEDREGGHTVSDSFKKVELMSRRIAFFMHRLK